MTTFAQYNISTICHGTGFIEWFGFMPDLDGAQEMARECARKWPGDVIYVTKEGDPEILFSCVVPK